MYAVKNEDLYKRKPLLLNVNLSTKVCEDENGNTYQLYPFLDALTEFSKENANIKNRLNYQWGSIKEKYCEREVDCEVRKEDEFSNFLRLFLNWQRHFFMGDKEVVDIRVISSAGPDVELVFAGGTIQKLELEHLWNNYLEHGHHTNNAFRKTWIFSEEVFDFPKILKLFSGQKFQNNDRIPDIFLSIDKSGRAHAYKIDWVNKQFTELGLRFEK